jgi:ataxin-3
MEANVEATEVGSLMNGEWYDFDSLYAAPQHLTKSSLAAYLDYLKGSA